MNTYQVTMLFLTHAGAVALLAAIGALVGGVRRLSVVVLILALLLLAGMTVVASLLLPGANAVLNFVGELAQLNRTSLSVAAVGAGLAAPWILLTSTRVFPRIGGFLVVCGFMGAMLVGALLAGREVISPYLPHRESTVSGTQSVNQVVENGFVLELVAELELTPVRVAVDPENGRVLLTGYVGISAQSGVLAEVELDANGQFKAERVLAPSLNKPHGLAIRGDDVYVSRSGQYSRWVNGRPDHASTGAVTLLRDLDGDGSIDYLHDVVSGLPGAQAPDFLHQNNAIAFDSAGSMYITSGISSDGHPGRYQWEGTILKADGPDYAEPRIFAKGLRNTFGLVVTQSDEIFATDNDSQSGDLGGVGDKLLRVRDGDDFGHPYSPPGAPGVTKPLLLSKFALAGATWPVGDTLPEPYRSSLYVAGYGEGRVMRYEIGADGETGSAQPRPFAVVPAVTDVAAAPGGVFYAVSFEKRTLHRIRYVGKAE